MRIPVKPYPDIPGDSEDKIMARTGEMLGFDKNFSVSRFGFIPGSIEAQAHGVCIPDNQGFVWVLATRKTGKIKDTFRGYALELPARFRNVIDREYV